MHRPPVSLARSAARTSAARRSARVSGGAALFAIAFLLGACGDATIAGPSSSDPSASVTESPAPSATPEPSASDAAAEIPNDCREMLSADVLDQLTDVPLNDPAFGDSGPRADGALSCIWADPGADTTSLQTVIDRVSRGDALDLLNDLVEDGFTCYEPDGGVRCEMTWENAQYPVTDGRTLFFREDILIDTTYSNLAPTGYTASIVASIWG